MYVAIHICEDRLPSSTTEVLKPVELAGIRKLESCGEIWKRQGFTCEFLPGP